MTYPSGPTSSNGSFYSPNPTKPTRTTLSVRIPRDPTHPLGPPLYHRAFLSLETPDISKDISYPTTYRIPLSAIARDPTFPWRPNLSYAIHLSHGAFYPFGTSTNSQDPKYLYERLLSCGTHHSTPYSTYTSGHPLSHRFSISFEIPAIPRNTLYLTRPNLKYRTPPILWNPTNPSGSPFPQESSLSLGPQLYHGTLYKPEDPHVPWGPNRPSESNLFHRTFYPSGRHLPTRPKLSLRNPLIPPEHT